jgi:macrolide transport system ATP-binding/permease protein
MSTMNFWRSAYRRLALAFPHEFKLAYGDEMLLAGEDAIDGLARRHGIAGLLRLLLDLAVRIPIEYLSEMRGDLRYAVRTLLKSPGFAFVGILSMGLGIGLTTNIYSSAWTMLARSLAGVPDPDRLVTSEAPLSFEYLRQYRGEPGLSSGVAAVMPGLQFNVGVGEHSTHPERVFGQIVSPDYFTVLGLSPQMGRLLSEADDKPGSNGVVITDRFWRSRLHADPDVIGQAIRINGQTATILGVTPPRFDGALSPNPSEIFVPTTAPDSMAPELSNDVLHQRNARVFQFLMRLAPGVTIDRAEAALDGITRRLDQLDPLAPPQDSAAKRVVLLFAGTRVPIPRQFKPLVLGFYIVLMGAVIAIACLNLATMLMARGANRRRELAIRLGVGASRFRLVRQMISEGILLSLLGSFAGLGLAYALWQVSEQARLPVGAPLTPDRSLDGHAVVLAFVLAIVCGVAFSIAPALQSTRTDVATGLREGAALQLSGYRRFGLRNLAMGAQVAGSLMLLLVTGFLVLGIMTGNSLATNFDQRTMVFLSVDPVRDGYAPGKAQAFFEQLPDRLRTSGSLSAFAFAAQAPYLSTEDQDDHQFTVEDSKVQRGVARDTVGAGYFAALSEPVLAGREFTDRDSHNGDTKEPAVAMPALLNQKAAHALFADANPLGKRMHDNLRTYEVVGLVPDLKDATGMVQPLAYLPLTEHDFAQPPSGGITIIARSHSAADALRSVRGVIASIDPNLTVFNVSTLPEYLEQNRAVMRSALRTFAGVGLFGLILSAIGLAGVTGYAVAQRRKEIGIRMALGARKSQVLGLVLREGFWLIAAGLVVGFLGAVALARALSAITSEFADAFRIGTTDPRLLVGAPLLLAALALLACYIPARRAARVDPLQALRLD